jgi:hypothetical protein
MVHPIHGGPLECPFGHPLSYPNVKVAFMRCDCQHDQGHTTWRCLTCLHVTVEQPHIPGREAKG